MRRAMLWLLGTMLPLSVPGAAGHAAETAANVPVANAIVFAVDVSGSVNTARYELQRAGIAAIFADERVDQFLADGLAVAIMEWSDGSTVVVPWTILHAPDEALALARRIAGTQRSPGLSTELSLAMLSAADLLDACPCAAATRIIDLSGDGPNNGPVSTPIARNEVVARGIRINGLPIVTPAEPELAQWYRTNVIGGDGAFLEVANGFEDFARAMRRKFELEIAGVRGAATRVSVATPDR